MTLVNNLRQKLADSEPCSTRHDLQVQGPGSAVNLICLQSDAMSCLLLELGVHREAPAGQDMRQWAQCIAERVTSLLEPLKVVEIDTDRHKTLLRSTGTRQQDNGLSYFEVILEGTTVATLRRFQTVRPAADTGPGRVQSAFALTHEGLLKLVGDLVSA